MGAVNLGAKAPQTESGMGVADNRASIGDALIFMTKMLVGSVVLIALALMGGWYWLVHSDVSREVSALRVQRASLEQALDEQKVTIADLGGKLNTCLVRAAGLGRGNLLTDEEFEQAVPPPPGFIGEKKPQ
jgi:hypothetical protein